jgi:class 3 adenylate cyclase
MEDNPRRLSYIDWLRLPAIIGMNSGAMIVSTIGDDLRMDYTAVGDTTNLASRMESTAKPGTIVVSSNTHKISDAPELLKGPMRRSCHILQLSY